jgi:hypothetical protein
VFNDKFGFRINGLGAVTVFTSGLLQSTIVVVLFLNVAFTLNMKLDGHCVVVTTGPSLTITLAPLGKL